MSTTNSNPVQRGRTYRRLTIGLVAVGCAALWGGMSIGQTLPGLVVYAATAVGAVGITLYGQFSDEVSLGDEREAQLERRASHLVFQLFGYLGLFVFIALFLLDATGRMAFPTAAEPLLYAYAVIYLGWGAVYGVFRYRS
jgi:uncharacterized membrane protein